MSQYLSETGLVRFADFMYPANHHCNPGKPAIFRCVNRKKKHYHVCSITSGSVVYVSLDFIKMFVSEWLPHITNEFILITGLSDYIVPYLQWHDPWDGYFDLLDSPYLKSWYCINKDINHPKIHAIPIGVARGMPFPTAGGERREIPYMGWTSGEYRACCVRMYLGLQKPIMEAMRSKRNSNKLLYLNYTTHNSEGANVKKYINFREKLDQYLKTTWFKKHELTDWVTYMETMKQYKFTLEPHGRAIDGYRVFESIIVGTIPIVFSSSVNEIRQDLPVLIIRKFSQLNPKYLEKKYKEIIARTDYQLQKLHLNYWTRKIALG